MISNKNNNNIRIRSLFAMATRGVIIIECLLAVLLLPLLHQQSTHGSVASAQNILGLCSYPPTGWPIPRSLDACTWYEDKTCCTKKDSQEIKKDWEAQASQSNFTIPDWINPLAPCMDELKLLSCLQCSPDQYEFIETELLIKPVAVRMCQSFCNRLYKKCALAKVGGETVAFAYKDGTDLCERGLAGNTDLQIKVVDDKCFNSGTQLAFSSIKILFASVAVLLAIKHLAQV